MKFCDKLSKIRKDNNLSQEQLADKMNVSRQAVSKWESGVSYPDMDKILNMCKILNCNLEDLLDDGVIGNSKVNNKININEYINEFLNFITKIYNMFWSMNFKEKIKCILEMFIIFIILLIFGTIAYSIIYEIIFVNIFNIPVIGFIIEKIIDPLTIILLIILGIIILIHLFKIRYLDYFVTIEDNNADTKKTEEAIKDEKIIDHKKYIVERPKEKIIIRDPKHSAFNFINLLGKIIMYIIKLFVLMFILPVVIITIFMIALLAVSFVFTKYGIMFLFIAVTILGCILISYVIINFAYNFIFNRKSKFKLSFVILIVGLTLIGVGSGLTAINFMEYDVKNISEDKLNVTDKEIKMENNIVISDTIDANYIIDNSLSNIKFKIKYAKGFDPVIYSIKLDEYKIYHLDYDFDMFDAYKEFKNDLKNHKITNFDSKMQVDIYISQDNYNILKQNEANY